MAESETEAEIRRLERKRKKAANRRDRELWRDNKSLMKVEGLHMSRISSEQILKDAQRYALEGNLRLAVLLRELIRTRHLLGKRSISHRAADLFSKGQQFAGLAEFHNAARSLIVMRNRAEEERRRRRKERIKREVRAALDPPFSIIEEKNGATRLIKKEGD